MPPPPETIYATHLMVNHRMSLYFILYINVKIFNTYICLYARRRCHRRYTPHIMCVVRMICKADWYIRGERVSTCAQQQIYLLLYIWMTESVIICIYACVCFCIYVCFILYTPIQASIKLWFYSSAGIYRATNNNNNNSQNPQFVEILEFNRK